MPIVSPHPININIAIAVAAHLSGLVAIHDLVSSRIDLMAAYTHIHRSILTYLYSRPHGSNANTTSLSPIRGLRQKGCGEEDYLYRIFKLSYRAQLPLCRFGCSRPR